MSESPNRPDELEAPEAFGDRKGVIFGAVLAIVILGAIAAVVGRRYVPPVDRLLGFMGLQ